jgi:hypothetical protein
MTFDKDFKLAISNLPSKEKDKLLLRLLKKDLTLANRLYFELVNTDSVDERRDNLEKHIIRKAQQITDRFYSPGILMMDMRELSGEINEHVVIAKDKYGDASLNLLLINKVLNLNHLNIERANSSKVSKLCIYIVAKVFKVLIIVNSLHEDFCIEFKKPLIILGNEISKSNYLIRTSIQHGLDVNWLLSDNIPDNIKEIHKDIRAQGLLK